MKYAETRCVVAKTNRRLSHLVSLRIDSLARHCELRYEDSNIMQNGTTLVGSYQHVPLVK